MTIRENPRDGRDPDLVTRVLRLWQDPVPPGDLALETFGAEYTDPVMVNGSAMALADVVQRARALQVALADRDVQLDRHVGAQGHEAFAFRITGRHVGVLDTPAGRFEPSGNEVVIQAIDLFVLDGASGRISEIWTIQDTLGLLLRAGAVGSIG